MIRYIVTTAFAIALSSWPAQAAERTVVLSVDKADCLGASIVRMSLLKVSGVKEVQVVESKLESPALATVIFDDTVASIEGLTTATTNAGYPSHLGN